MRDWVIDSNVPIVANGRDTGSSPPTLECRIAAIEFLLEVVKEGRIVVDFAGEVQREYRRYLNPKGEPGVGDRFYQTILNSHPNRVIRLELTLDVNGEFHGLSDRLKASSFDRSDRKFVALAAISNSPVVNCVDTDWIEHSEILNNDGVSVVNLCGCETDTWRTDVGKEDVGQNSPRLIRTAG